MSRGDGSPERTETQATESQPEIGSDKRIYQHLPDPAYRALGTPACSLRGEVLSDGGNVAR